VSKVLKSVAILAGAVALAASGFGLAAGIGTMFEGSLFGISAATFGTIGAIASAVSVAPGAAEHLLSKGAGP
jgi:hypothetical protein